ncbi:Vesicle-associated protein 2-2 [Dichanthelium oligosanthes]|uniref:Vesicle-associated protein 2-2 n=1 Tax=Dichanthelium oligosanthes TaxID=888268 RepID=A0A1E5WA90_9POAL|nr:Vesicle-associated protein 2-2 [Dichanthelium oligosanthes]
MGSEDVLVEIHPCELRFLSLLPLGSDWGFAGGSVSPCVLREGLTVHVLRSIISRYLSVFHLLSVEVKKQSSCCVDLVNKSDQYVAFKVKTTSPKRYCVRPNVGVIPPLASRDFTVTMQAPKNAPPDLQVKDKFLVQTTVVPFGTADEDIVPAFFSKETDRYIEEKKLKVVLVSMTQPQVEQPASGVLHAKETVGVPVAEKILDNVNEAKETVGVSVAEEILDNVNEAPNVVNEVRHPLKASFPPLRGTPATYSEISSVKECPTVLQRFLVPPKQASFTLSESAPNLQENSAISVESHFSSTETSADLKSPPLEYTPAPSEVPSLSDIESTNTDNLHISHVTEDVHTLQMKLNDLEVKLEEAETLIVKLREETRTTIQERDKLQKEMVKFYGIDDINL